MARGQGSSEFLIIFAAVFLVVLIVTYFIVQGTGANYDTRYYQSKVFWNNEKPIAITDAKAIQGGLTLLVKNTGTTPLTIRQIEVKEDFVQYRNSTGTLLRLEPGMSAKVLARADYPEPIGNRKFLSFDMRFDYDSEISKGLIGREKLILPVPSTCNVIGEYCSYDGNCCNGVYCVSGTCGGCVELGGACNLTAPCCGDMDCISGFCRQRPNLIPLFSAGGACNDYVTYQILNLGPGNASNSTARLSLLCTGTCTSTTYYPIDPLAAGDSQNFNSPMTCASLAYVNITADWGDAINETDETNNNIDSIMDPSLIPCSNCVLPDLVASASTTVLYGQTHYVGIPFQVPVTTRNNGSAPAGNSTTEVRFNGTTIDSIAVGVLAVSASYTRDVTVTCTAVGNFTFQLDADEGNAVDEGPNELNTVDYDDIECVALPAGQPDLIAAIPNPPTELECTVNQISLNTSNIGLLLSNASITRIESDDEGLLFNGNYNLQFSVPSLAPSASNETAKFFIACAQCGPNTQRNITVRADYTNTNAEGAAGEANNVAIYPVMCNPLPDLIAFASDQPPAGPQTVGVPFPIAVQTNNSGTGTAPASTTRVNSTSGTLRFNGAAYMDVAVGTLSGGDSSPNTAITVNCTAAGIQTIRVAADYQNIIPETSEVNNVNTYTVNCTNPPAPDLVAWAVDSAILALPPVINVDVGDASGQTIRTRTNNNGSATALASTTRMQTSSPNLLFRFINNPAVNGTIMNTAVASLAQGANYSGVIYRLYCASAGTFTVTMTADVNWNVAEGAAGEANNVRTYTVNCQTACTIPPGGACSNGEQGADPNCCTGVCARNVCCYNPGWDVDGNAALCCSLYVEGDVCRGRRPGMDCDFNSDCDSASCVGGICAQYGPDESGWNGCRDNAECSTDFCGRQGNAWGPSCCRGPSMSCSIPSDCCGGGSTCSAGACTCKPSGPTSWCFQDAECCSDNCIIVGNNGYCG